MYQIQTNELLNLQYFLICILPINHIYYDRRLQYLTSHSSFILMHKGDLTSHSSVILMHKGDLIGSFLIVFYDTLL